MPDYDELMERISALSAEIDPGSNYLYEKDVYDPDNDPDLMPTESEEETPAQEAEVTTKEFEVPDFLENEEDDIFKIE